MRMGNTANKSTDEAQLDVMVHMAECLYHFLTDAGTANLNEGEDPLQRYLTALLAKLKNEQSPANIFSALGSSVRPGIREAAAKEASVDGV